MNKILVISPKVCSKSAKTLAESIGADYSNPYLSEIAWNKYTHIFNYGYSGQLPKNNGIINKKFGVEYCVDKLKTLFSFKYNNIPTLNSTTNKEIARKSNWETIVCNSSKGNRARDIKFISNGEELPNADLYSEYYPHKYEMRVVVFMGKIVGRYWKEEINGVWDLVLLDKVGFKQLDADCIKAAKGLGIDYVGFDVLIQTKKRYIIIEANSGPVLTEEALDVISNYYGDVLK